MNSALSDFLAEHSSLTRRYFLRCGTAGVAALGAFPIFANAGERDPALQKVLDGLETWLTKQEDFRDVSRGNPKPHSFDDAKNKEVGLTRDTWSLEVLDDPEDKIRLRNPLTKEKNTVFTFKDLMQLAEKHAVRFPKVMTCLNLGCPLSNGIWEGVVLQAAKKVNCRATVRARATGCLVRANCGGRAVLPRENSRWRLSDCSSAR